MSLQVFRTNLILNDAQVLLLSNQISFSYGSRIKYKKLALFMDQESSTKTGFIHGSKSDIKICLQFTLYNYKILVKWMKTYGMTQIL